MGSISVYVRCVGRVIIWPSIAQPIVTRPKSLNLNSFRCISESQGYPSNIPGMGIDVSVPFRWEKGGWSVASKSSVFGVKKA